MDRSIYDKGRQSLRALGQSAVKAPLYLCDRILERRFDRAHGIDTVGKLEVDYGPDCRNAEFAYRYEPINLRIFRRIMKDLPFTGRDTAFIDLGSGKGRALILASGYSFGSIVGVELSDALHQVAERNTHTPQAQARFAGRLELHCMDAASYELPDRDCVVFLYNPFAEEVLAPLLERLEQHPHRLAIVYRNPKFADLLDGRSSLKLFQSTRHYRIYVNALPHPHIEETERS